MQLAYLYLPITSTGRPKVQSEFGRRGVGSINKTVEADDAVPAMVAASKLLAKLCAAMHDHSHLCPPPICLPNTGQHGQCGYAVPVSTWGRSSG